MINFQRLNSIMMMLLISFFFAGHAAFSSDLPSDDEMEGINQIVEETEVMKMLKTQAERHDKELRELKASIESQLNCEFLARGSGIVFFQCVGIFCLTGFCIMLLPQHCT